MMLCLKMGSLKNSRVVPHSQVTSSSYLVHDHNVLDYFGLFHHVFPSCFPFMFSLHVFPSCFGRFHAQMLPFFFINRGLCCRCFQRCLSRHLSWPGASARSISGPIIWAMAEGLGQRWVAYSLTMYISYIITILILCDIMIYV